MPSKSPSGCWRISRLRSTTRTVLPAQYCPLFREKAGRAKSFLRNSVSLVGRCENNVVCDNRTTARAVVCKQAYTTALPIFTILADSGYSRKRIKNRVLFSATAENKRLILILYKNIDISPKPPFGKRGLSRRGPLLRVQRLSGFPGYAVQLTQ